jgi:hypothetical protein
MNSTNKALIQQFLFAVGIYVFAFTFIYAVLYFLGLINILPDKDNIVKWDAGWYGTIKDNGYQYKWYQASNSAFFPLFPYAWKLLHVKAIGICLVNFIVYLTGAFLLYVNLGIRRVHLLCYMAIPSAIFFFLPFSEALFFLFSSILLVGLFKGNIKMILVGLLLCSITRATAMFFVPAIIVMEVFNSEKLFSKQSLKNIALYSFVSLLGLMLVVLFQYSQTETWFAFAKQQFKFWHHHFSWPSAPFVSYGEDKIIWADGLALFFGLLATSLLLAYTVKFFLKKADGLMKNKAFWFSATYLFMVTVYSLFFNEKNVFGNTSLVSMNRYLFSTAFFLCFIGILLKEVQLNKTSVLFYVGVLLLTLVLLGIGMPLPFLKEYTSYHRATIFFVAFGSYLLLYLFLKHKSLGTHVGVFLFTINILLSVYLLTLYMKGLWVA